MFSGEKQSDGFRVFYEISCRVSMRYSEQEKQDVHITPSKLYIWKEIQTDMSPVVNYGSREMGA